jgi:endonuclease YncB( thermonuclease family)
LDTQLTRTGRQHSVQRIILGFFLLALSFYASSSWAWEGTVTSVADGSTIAVAREGKTERIRLYGTECPEKRQDFFQKAKDLTSEMVFRKVVEIVPLAIDRKGHSKDPYGRTLGLVYNASRVCLNEKLIASGLAWVDIRSCTKPECKSWKELERQAKRQKLGLWSMPNPIPPWEFRHSKGAPIPIYHGDIVKHVFHSSNCEEFDCNSCIVLFRGRDEAVRAGYKACSICNP